MNVRILNTEHVDIMLSNFFNIFTVVFVSFFGLCFSKHKEEQRNENGNISYENHNDLMLIIIIIDVKLLNRVSDINIQKSKWMSNTREL